MNSCQTPNETFYIPLREIWNDNFRINSGAMSARSHVTWPPTTLDRHWTLVQGHLANRLVRLRTAVTYTDKHLILDESVTHKCQQDGCGCPVGSCAVLCARNWSTFQKSQGDNEDSKHLWNVGKLPPNYMAKHLRRQPSLYSSPWEPWQSANYFQCPDFEHILLANHGSYIFVCGFSVWERQHAFRPVVPKLRHSTKLTLTKLRK
jgi:hypothetical protein